MALSDLFGQNALVKWLVGDTASIDLAVTMSGVELGERVLIAGCRDPRLAAALAARSGLSGHVVAVDSDESALAAMHRAAAKAGVLVEVERASTNALPFETASFDLVVAGTTTGAATFEYPRATFDEIVRVLRPGGRAIVVQRAPRRGVVGTVQATVDAGTTPADLRATMTAAGLRAVRLLAERDQLVFFEGARGQ